MFNRKIFFINLIYSSISSILPLIIIQAIVMPLISKEIGASFYGDLITSITMINIVSVNIGSGLHSSRLLNKTKKDQSVGIIFNNILIKWLIINTVIILFLTVIYLKIYDFSMIIVILFYSLSSLIINYIIVEFRLKLNYKKILIHNIVMSLSTLICFFILRLIYNFTDFMLAFLVGNVMTIFYDLIALRYKLRFQFKKDYDKDINKSTNFYIFSTFLISTGIYFDKIIIFPIIGSENVSYLYVATLLGKSILTVIGSFLGLLLSYIINIDLISQKQVKFFIIFSMIISIFTFFSILIFNDIFVSFLYFDYIEIIKKYTLIIAFSYSILVFINILFVLFLKIYESILVLQLNFIYFVFYIICGIIFTYIYGLEGFIWSTIIVNSTKLLYIIKKINIRRLQNET